MIAPEGTRLDTTSVGPFKKGPFRMAMAVGIPIVPIVIRNAEIIAARNSTTMNPGTVDVAVFPPIPVTDWTLETLADRIAEVRQLYVDTLADWPVDELPEIGPYRREKKAAPKKAPRKAASKPAKATTAKPTAAKAGAAKATAAKATAAKATAAKATSAKAAKKAQPKTPARKATKAQPATPRPRGRS